MGTSFEKSKSLLFEIHATRIGQDEPYDPNSFPWDSKKKKEEARSKPLTICESDGLVWARDDSRSKSLERVRDSSDATVGFRFVRHRGKAALAMLPRTDGALVNGRPALPLAILSVKDCLVLGHAVHAYVTERVRPYIGPPPAEYLSKQCPFCRIPFTPETELVTCRCGAAYHYERNGPGKSEDADEPLMCFEKARRCLACERPLVLEEYLEWDPAKL